MIITIDGPVATGKSTIARRLSQSLGFIYFDTGAMYRIVTYAVLKHQVNVDDPAALAAFLKDFTFRIRTYRGEKKYTYQDEDITLKIRDDEVTQHVSKVSAIQAVREKLVILQRELSIGVNAVFEGRDMGSFVFPDAPLKIFLTATAEERARRRFEENKDKFPEKADQVTYEQVLKETNERDLYDSNRQFSPLIKASDAYEIDCTAMTAEEVVYKILEYKDTVRPKAKQGR